MNLDLLTTIFELCVIPLLGVLTAYVVNYIKVKSDELVNKTESEIADKYIQMLSETIMNCVTATNQTYVSGLKKENLFTKEAQLEAFKKTYDAIMSILTEDAKKYLTEIYGDLTAYITMRIEAEVKLQK